MKYEFTDDYKTGIAEIDEEHARLFAITNQAYDTLMDPFAVDKYDKITQILEELRDYTHTHFANEEAYMEKIAYAKRWSQKKSHMEFLARIDGMDLAHIDENQQEALVGIIEFLAKWLTGHILGMDKKIPQET